jgi:hypothetical protein
MDDRLAHAVNGSLIGSRARVCIENACDSAHVIADLRLPIVDWKKSTNRLFQISVLKLRAT